MSLLFWAHIIILAVMARLFSTPRRLAFALAAGLVLFSVLAVAKDVIPVGELSVSQIEDELQVNMKLSLPLESLYRFCDATAVVPLGLSITY